jgi:hypothetical protein
MAAHEHQAKAGGSVETLPLPPIVLAALRIARQMQAQRRTASWPKACIYCERRQLLFTTNAGQPIEPRNLKRSFDARCKKVRLAYVVFASARLLGAITGPSHVARYPPFGAMGQPPTNLASGWPERLI